VVHLTTPFDAGTATNLYVEVGVDDDDTNVTAKHKQMAAIAVARWVAMCVLINE
jgi:hypothetical protein